MIMAGCSYVNFSANYYDPPSDYKEQTVRVWSGIAAGLHLKNRYSINVIDRDAAAKTHGIPFISGNNVYLPDDFIKYVFQNYYDDRFTVFACVIAHEVCHTEYGLPSEPPDVHFKTDVAAIQLLGNDTETAFNYYRSLFVMRNYWFARKGVAGHSFNVGWNLINGASMALGGPAVFKNWFATDLSKRMKLISRQYKIPSRKCFPRSSNK